MIYGVMLIHGDFYYFLRNFEVYRSLYEKEDDAFDPMDDVADECVRM